MTLCSVITETIVIADPHAGHRSGSISKMRRSSRAQLAREGEGPGSGGARPPRAVRVPGVIADEVVARQNPIRVDSERFTHCESYSASGTVASLTALPDPSILSRCSPESPPRRTAFGGVP